MMREIIRGTVFGAVLVVVTLAVALVTAPAWAATYYVDQELSSNGDGSIGSPWNAVANILTATIAPADTICIKGAFTGAGWTVTEAGTSGNVTVYDFNCSGWGQGSITATSGTAAVLANKGFTTVKNGRFTYASGPAIQINASDVRIEANTIDGGDQGILLTASSERDRVVIDGNTVRNIRGNGTADASAAGIYMLQTATARWEWDDLTITDNILTNNLQGGINLKCDFGATTCLINRMTISGNLVVGNLNTGIVVQDCYELGATSCADADTNANADFTDVVIENNIVTGQLSGGGMAIYGLKSSTNAHGKNIIRGNTASDNVGVIGGIDLFNSLYVTVEDNITNGNSTASIDGNGILIDYGNRYTVVRRNEASGNVGLSGVPNSGVGIMALKCEDLSIYSNAGINNRVGLFFAGASFVESGCAAYNNTFSNSTDYGVYVDLSQDGTTLTLTNNALTGPGVCINAEAGGAAQTENYNDLACTRRDNFDDDSPTTVVDWTDGAATITAEPLFSGGTIPTTVAGLKPRAASPLIRAGTCLLSQGCLPRDKGSRRPRVPPDIGAWQRTVGDP